VRPSEIGVDRSEPGVAIVAVRGEHEAFSAPRLAGELEALLGEGLAVVVDLSDADFLDSTVVSVLLRARWDARQRGSKLALVVDDSTGWAVRRLFEVTGLDDIFDITRDRETAVATVLG
jgi:anti-anti-sigma factor